MSLEEPTSTDDIDSIQGLHEYSLDVTAREDVYRNVIHSFISSGKGKQLKILVVGEAGQGKSTLINALVGQEVAKEGDEFEAGTNSVQQYVLSQNGVEIGLWDSPGLGLDSDEEDQKIVEKLKISFTHSLPDLVLFCIRMDQTRIPTKVHKDTIIKFTEVFGDEFWKHALFILTFANNTSQMCPEGTNLERFFSQRCDKIGDQLKSTLQKHSRLNADELAEIRVVPVGSTKTGIYQQNPWALPDREDWFIFFWIDVANRLPESALSAILQVNHHRLVDDAHMSLSSAEVELYQRELQATYEELETVNKIVKEGTASQSIAHAVVSRDLPSDSNPPQQHPKRALATEYKNEKTKPIHGRKIPVHIILMKQLEKENSGFWTYLKTFASKRGEELKLVGHIGGLFEGMLTYLSKKKHNKSKTS